MAEVAAKVRRTAMKALGVLWRRGTVTRRSVYKRQNVGLVLYVKAVGVLWILVQIKIVMVFRMRKIIALQPQMLKEKQVMMTMGMESGMRAMTTVIMMA